MNAIKTLYSEQQIQSRVAELAAEINRTLPPGELDIIGVLRGSFIFMGDLVRRLDRACRMDFIKVSSYGANRVSSGEIRLLSDTSLNLAGRRVLIVEDIVDSGMSLKFLRSHLLQKRPEGLWCVSLLFKRVAANAGELRNLVNFVGFEVEGNPFVVGYGLDDNENHRNLPYVGVVQD